MSRTKKAKLAVLALTVMAVVGCRGKPEAGNESAPSDLDNAAAPAPVPPSAQGVADDASIQRGYPSIDEEKALGLDYPLFLRYSSDMARLTPFFPGSSERPLSVKLKESANGYSLKAEGGGCKFAIVYELKKSDGRVEAQGEYHEPEATSIPGWQGEPRELTVRMADGAENNYSCNVLVSKL
jgi:hypothetical protein